MEVSGVTAVTSFLWNIFTNILSNRLDEAVFGDGREGLPSREDESGPFPEQHAASTSSRRFRTFDARYDIERFVLIVQEPIVHLLVEESPSTHYNLPAYVLESQRTGEWFVFSRGRIALQGTGGGRNNMDSVVEILRSKETQIVGWVVASRDLDALEGGFVTWPTVKSDIIPLLSYHSDRHEWSEIKRRFKAYFGEEPPNNSLKRTDQSLRD
jgi:hypothetical protein